MNEIKNILKVNSLWEANLIELFIGAEDNRQQTLWHLTLSDAKKLQEKLDKAIEKYEDMEQIAQEYCSPDKAESEDPKPSDWMNF